MSLNPSEQQAVATIRECLHHDRAPGLLRGYLAPGAFTGNRFELLAGGGDRQATRDRITGDDVASLALLAVPLNGREVRYVLEDGAEDISQLLREIPVVDLATARGQEALADGGPADQLYELLRSFKGLGPAKVSKLMARKRPALVPIRDSEVSRLLADVAGWWKVWRTAFADSAVIDQIDALRRESGAGHLTRLRTADIVLWRIAKEDAATA